MIPVEHLLLPAKNISQGMINKQILTVKKAYEVLTEYRRRADKKGGKWEIYKRLRGVMLADEVGMGKTFEALALATEMYLKQTSGRRNRFRILILAAPAIQSKWEWCGSGVASRPTKKRENHDEYSMCRPTCDRYGACDNSGPAQHDVGVFLKALRLKRRKDDVENLLSSLCLHRIRSKKDWWNHANRRPGSQAVFLAGIQTLPGTYGRDKSIAFKRSGRRESFPLDGNFFDLIIADEAHIARRDVEVEENKPSPKALRKIKALLNHSPKAQILLLTATPFQNDNGEFKRLLELLEYGDVLKQNDKTVIQCIKEGLDNTYKTYNELLSCVRINNVNAVDEGKTIKSLYSEADLDFDQDPNTNFRPRELTNKKIRILEGLDDYLRDVVTRNRRKRLVPNCVFRRIPATYSD
jgi:hypothetical protein